MAVNRFGPSKHIVFSDEEVVKQIDLNNVRGVSSLGRRRSIESPEVLWSLFELYLHWVEDNPIYKVEQAKGKIDVVISIDDDTIEAWEIPALEALNEAKLIKLPCRRPLSLEGFAMYLQQLGIEAGLEDINSNKGSERHELSEVMTRIRLAVRADRVEGGLLDIYNAPLVARLEALADSITTTHVEQPFFGKRDNPESEEL